ncbi:MAG: isochorismatase family protein [Bauldia sp.]|jgi:nicotinamidase-related amidase|nr:isochorismatase family protein [Bauldia sp.]
MNIIRLPLQRQRPLPIVCFVDLQVEYIAKGRPLAVDANEPWMGNCRRLLAFAREHRLPIAHFRQLRREAYLNAATDYASWIDEFRPRPSEMIFERSMPSCYAAQAFAAVTQNMDHPVFVIAGLTSTGACLATALDAYHRQHTSLFVADASWSPAIGGASEEESNVFATELIRQYSDVTNIKGLLEWLSKEQVGIAS